VKSYLSSIRRILISDICFTFLAGTQILLNIYYERKILSILFGIIFIYYFFSIVLLTLDLIIKDIRTMKVRIVEIESEIIRVLKPNGKKRRIRIIKSEIGRYQIDQELELILTKRTGQIIDVKLS